MRALFLAAVSALNFTLYFAGNGLAINLFVGILCGFAALLIGVMDA